MAKDNDLESYLRNLRNGKEEKQQTFDWYLRKIRDLAKKQEDPRSLNVLLTGTEEVKRQKKEDKSRQESRDEMSQPSISSVSGAFSNQMLGKMLFYMYDAKYKDSLPYWDQFPLVFPINTQSGNKFLGMNLHYLPPVHRAKLMAALMTLSNTTTLAPQTKLTMTYKLLNSSSKYIYFKPCIKSYLYSHIRSRIMTVNPEQWMRVLFLPTANFLKNTEDKVWQDSINKIRDILNKK